METTNARVETRRTGSTAWPAIGLPRETLVRTITSAWRWLMSERWILELLTLALALILVVAAAAYGLAVVSTWAPIAQSLAAVQPAPTSHAAEASPIEQNLCEEGIR